MKTHLLSTVAAFLTIVGLATAQEPVVVPDAQPDWIMGPLDNGILPPEGNGLPPVSPACQPADNGDQCEHEPFCWHQDVDRCVPHIWAGADYLMWWVKNGPTPLVALTLGQVTSVTNDATLAAYAPALVGSNGFDYGTANGVRARAGGWFGCDQIIGLEGTGFLLPRLGTGSTATVTEEFAAGTAVPGVSPNTALVSNVAAAGTVEKLTSYNRLWGADANFLVNILRNDYCELTLLTGFRFVNLAESDNITVSYSDLVDPIIDQAHVGTQNRFYGGQIGGKFETGWGCLFVNGIADFALGSTYERLTANVQGAASTGGITQGITSGSVGGGTFRVERFAVVPEAQVNVGWQICPCARLSVGYDFLYWSDVVRPGTLINSAESGSHIIPQTDFWAHGVTAGLELRF